MLPKVCTICELPSTRISSVLARGTQASWARVLGATFGRCQVRTYCVVWRGSIDWLGNLHLVCVLPRRAASAVADADSEAACGVAEPKFVAALWRS